MKNLQLLCILILCNFGCSAQNNIPSNAKEILISKNWKVDGSESDIYKIVFTNTTMGITLNGNSCGEEEYYLSDNLNDCSGGFVQSKVGINSNGKYIVAKASCLEIIILNSTKLIVKSLINNSITTASPM